ncbi:MAG: PRC-barrel domain-containing protein [Halobacteriota archaeon]|nr:PRC-barrel domain-containing protein [Halobacteriota archaeon]
MSKVFATEMVDKKVLSTDGDNIGTLNNIIIDLRSGNLVDLVVKLDLEADKGSLRVNEVGSAFLSFESVRAIKDYIVVDRNEG